MEIFSFFLEWSWLDRIYLLFAIAGTLMFLLRIAIGALFGGDGHDGDLSGDGTMTHDTSEFGADASFKLMTIQGMTAFVMMFGLVGLALRRGSHTSELTSIIGAFIAGMAMALVLAKIAQMMRGLKSSGTIQLQSAVGARGTVYLSIPAEGTGQAQVTVQNRLRMADARSADHQPIKTGEMIEVVDVINGNLLIVKKL